MATTLYLAVDDDTYLNVDVLDFDSHILIDIAVPLGMNQRVRVIRDGSTGTVSLDTRRIEWLKTRDDP